MGHTKPQNKLIQFFCLHTALIMTSLKGGNGSSILCNTIIGINVGWDCILICKLTLCSSLMTVWSGQSDHPHPYRARGVIPPLNLSASMANIKTTLLYLDILPMYIYHISAISCFANPNLRESNVLNSKTVIS